MSERKCVFRLYTAWNDDKEERWLEEMARSGWHLVSGPFPYTFERGAPAEIRYRLDYPPQDSNLPEYLRLCHDAGWERVCESAGWQYFRTASAEAPEIYTDNASRIGKYRRQMVICLFLAITTTLPNIPGMLDHSPGPLGHKIVIGVARWLSLTLVVV